MNFSSIKILIFPLDRIDDMTAVVERTEGLERELEELKIQFAEERDQLEV